MTICKINNLLVTNLLLVENLLEQTNALLQPLIGGVFGFELEDSSGVLLLENSSILLLENAGGNPYWQMGED